MADQIMQCQKVNVQPCLYNIASSLLGYCIWESPQSTHLFLALWLSSARCTYVAHTSRHTLHAYSLTRTKRVAMVAGVYRDLYNPIVMVTGYTKSINHMTEQWYLRHTGVLANEESTVTGYHSVMLLPQSVA